MKSLVKPLGFSIALIFAFASVTYVLPQVKGEAPEDEEVSVGSLTMESFIAMGEKAYKGKGTCTLCHNQLGRAPDMLAFNVVQVSEERLADTRYQGKATDVESYLRESMLEPSAYVVEGFGKKGSNDTESPMPAVDKPPIQLSELVMDAIIAYLQKKDGNPVTVSQPQCLHGVGQTVHAAIQLSVTEPFVTVYNSLFFGGQKLSFNQPGPDT